MKLKRISPKKVVIESDEPIYTMNGDGVAILVSDQPIKSFQVYYKSKSKKLDTTGR